MKATGIVRRIDDLGRIVIPKEIRRTLRIRESDPLEIFTDREGEIILKKYSPIGEMATFAKQYAESLAQVSGHAALIADRDQFIAAAGGYKQMVNKSVSRQMEEKIHNRETIMASRGDRSFIPVCDEGGDDYQHEAIAPILCEGDILTEIAKTRGMLISGGEPDTERAAAALLDEYRGGKIGKITLETPQE